MLKPVVAVLFVLTVAACNKEANLPEPYIEPKSHASDSTYNGDGHGYVNDLLKAIESSDRIVVTEHSDVHDVLDEETQPQRPENYTPIIYASRELGPKQRATLLAAVKAMPAKTQDAFPACIFEPHHTISLYRVNKKISEMRICFQCGQVEWDGTRDMNPWALVPMLRKFIVDVGLQDKRDWYALVRSAKP